MATKIVMPKLGMVMSEGTIAKWVKSPGDTVANGEIIAEIETEKLNYDLEATGAGLLHSLVSEGDTVPVDGIIGYLLAEGESVPAEPSQQASSTPIPSPANSRMMPSAPQPRTGGLEVRSTPGARRLAAKLGMNISQVTPTGPRGRVTEADVRNHSDRQTPDNQNLPPGLPEPSKKTQMTGMRKSIAEHMKGSLAKTAQLSFFTEVDVTEAQRARKNISNNNNSNVTLANVFMKACAETLKQHSDLNTILMNDQINYFEDIDIGMAVSITNGLVVPVVRKAHEKTILEISDETQDLVNKAKDGTLLPDDLAGGTFTISVLGIVDGFTPILNSGQSAIMGIGRSIQKPVVKKGEIVVREITTVSLTVDHQVIDGAVAASFLRRFQQIVERPSRLFK